MSKISLSPGKKENNAIDDANFKAENNEKLTSESHDFKDERNSLEKYADGARIALSPLMV